jgi:nitrilase
LWDSLAVDLGVVRVAAIQASPSILDLEGCVATAERLVREAAAEGADLAVLPECFVPMYPMSRLTHSNGDPRQTDLFEQIWLNSVEVPGPIVDRFSGLCRELGIHLAVGVNEREASRSGSLYNTLLLFGPGGLLHKHRKLMPTNHERLFHGIGGGDDLKVLETPFGRIGGLICMENLMPLARYKLYRQRPQIWLAPTMDDSDAWPSLIRTIAWESGAWVIAVCGFVRRNDYPPDLSAVVPRDGPDVLCRGGTMVAAPDGQVVAGPLYDQEGMLIVDCDLRQTIRAKYAFDSAGHYSREDALLQQLNGPLPDRRAEPAFPTPGD